MSDKESYTERMEAHLKELATRIGELKVKADNAKVTARSEYQKQIEELRVKQKELRTKLDKMKGTSGEAWKDLKTGVEKAAQDLRDSLNQAISKFKQ